MEQSSTHVQTTLSLNEEKKADILNIFYFRAPSSPKLSKVYLLWKPDTIYIIQLFFFFANKYFDYLQEQKELTATELNFIERPIIKNT